ncbi:hypothetical protein AgCh_034778 [Apium graveolens]
MVVSYQAFPITVNMMLDVHQGLVNPSLLHLQHTHRSLDIWRLGGGDMLKCHRKNPNNEDDLPPLDLRMVPLLQSTGFYGVARVASLQLDWSLISALVERWQPETHTFHLPMGEVTITLQDVGVLLGLHVDGDAVISDVIPGPDMSWRSYVAELFGRDLDPKRDMNESRVRLSFITSCAPARLPHDASANDIRFQVLCYLVHLFGGVLFTDHSGGLFHPMFLHFIRDLDRCGDYAWAAAVLAYLYRELCKTSKKDVDEVAGCLLLLQLWAWERLPTLAPIRTSSILFDARFWEGQVAAPRGLRWLHGHSYTSTGGRALSSIRTLLDGLGPSQFIWRHTLLMSFLSFLHIVSLTIPVDVVYSEAEHSTNLRGNDKIRWIQKHAASTSIWAHHLDHLFVGDAIVAASSVPEYHPWYLERTVRFISRVGAFNHRIDLMFRQISERTQDVLPDVSRYADQCCDFVRAYTLHGFDKMPVEVRRARQLEERQQPARRGRRGGGRAAGGRRARVLVYDDPIAAELGADGIPLHSDSYDVPESSTHVRTDPMATDLGDDRDPPVRVSVAHTVAVHVSGSSTRVQHDSQIPDRYGYVPPFDLSLTPTPEQPRTEDPSTEQPRTEDPSTEQPPPLYRPHRPTEHVSMDFFIPSFSLHVTPTSPTDLMPVQMSLIHRVPRTRVPRTRVPRTRVPRTVPGSMVISTLFRVNGVQREPLILQTVEQMGRIKDQIVVDPTVKEKVLMATVKSIFGYQPGRKKIRDAKKLAMDEEHGSWEGSYEDLPFLMEAFQCFNVGTKEVTIKRLLWAFKPCIDGFEHCIHVIHIDGTHLYGPYSGVLLSVVAVDGFSHILPLAFAIVESENVSSWGWFMDRLRRFVAGRRHGICVISDRHAGIIAAMQQIGWCEPLDHHRLDNASMVYNGIFEPIPSKGDSRWPTVNNFPTVIHDKDVEKNKGRRKSTRYQNAMDFQAPKGKK